MSRALSTKADPIQEALMKESVIKVDENDRILGAISKRDSHLIDSKGQSVLHRAFSLFIFNADNELLLQQRSDVKFTFPGLWTNSCCSHPLHVEGEMNGHVGAKKAAQRRAKIELGVECEAEKMHFLGRILYAAPSKCEIWGEHELDYILFLKNFEGQINPNENEVKDFKFIRRQDLNEFINQVKSEGGQITPWFELIAKTSLPKWWENLDDLKRFQNNDQIVKFT